MFNLCFDNSNSFQPQQDNHNQYNCSESNYFNDSLQTYSYTNPNSGNKNESSSSSNSIESYQPLQNNHTVFHETRNSHCQDNHEMTIDNRTANHETSTNYNENRNKYNNMTMLEDTLTIEILLYALKKGITNAQNALNIAKMVSILINKTENDEIAKEIIKKLTNKNIVNMLTNSIVKYSNSPQIIKECQCALNLIVKTLLINNMSVDVHAPVENSIQIGSQQSKSAPISKALITNSIQTGSEESKSEPISKLGHKCEECGKWYKHLYNLKTHSKIHTENCYICSFCNKRFGRKYNYTQHIRVHTGESPFQCSVCHKRFKQKHGLTNHLKKCHSDPWLT